MRKSPAWLLGRLAVHLEHFFGPPPAALGDRLSTYQRPALLRCSCGALAADDELDICRTCRPRRDRARKAAEVEAYREDRLRTRRIRAAKRRDAEKRHQAEHAARRYPWPPNVVHLDEPAEQVRPAAVAAGRGWRG